MIYTNERSYKTAGGLTMEIKVYYEDGKLVIDYPEELTESEALMLVRLSC
jgi:hypothetical protein